MFNGIELILGLICSLMGIAVGYLLLVTVFAGIQLLSKHRSETVTTAVQSYWGGVIDKFKK